jgi:SAM-dependent methyltransferase
VIAQTAIETVEYCPLCRSHNLAPRFAAKDTLHGMPGTWEVVECADCGLMHTSPRPTREAMASFYPDEYQPHAEHFASGGDEGGALRRLARRILDPGEVVIPEADNPRKVLEVGCGSGRTLVELADRGWDVHGLEPSAAAVATLRAHRDLPVTVGAIAEADFAPAAFDVIIASMVLEHLHDPVADARRLHGWLRPGGHLTGSVPNCSSWEFRFFGPDWFALQVPTHLFHYTPATLTRALEEAGFRGVRIHQQRNVNNLMVHAGRFLERHRLPFATTCLEFPERASRALRLAVRPPASILAWIGQAGRISFVARRP